MTTPAMTAKIKIRLYIWAELMAEEIKKVKKWFTWYESECGREYELVVEIECNGGREAGKNANRGEHDDHASPFLLS